MRVVDIDAEATHDLRRRILRDGRPEAEVRFAGDTDAGAFHLGVVDDEGTVVAVASFYLRPTPHRAGASAVQMRGMAVEPRLQGAGLGRLLVDAAAERLRREHVEVLWANGRDAALGFYRRLGWEVVGEGFVTDADVPHHVVLVDLQPEAWPNPPVPPPPGRGRLGA